MFDTHSHLTIEPIYSNIDRVVSHFVLNKGEGILNVSFDEQSITSVFEIYNKYKDRYPNLIHNAIGIHPEHFTEIFQAGKDIHLEYRKIMNRYKETLSTFRNIVCAIGETGIDYHHLENLEIENIDKEVLIEIQKNSFKEHVALSIENSLPLTIHSRDITGSNRAIEDTLSIISNAGKGKACGSFHSYTGDKEYLEDILALNFYIGFNAIVTYTNADNVRELVNKTPLERILLETDAPYLIPKEVRRDKNAQFDYAVPSHVIHTAKVIADIKKISLEKVIEITNANAKNLFFIH